MPALADAKPVHARWSEVNREFLEFVERNPAYLDRASFGSIYRETWLHHYSVQPWPLFMGSAQRCEMGAVAVAMDGLVKEVMERFLGNDPARIVDFYRTRGTMDGRPSMALHLNEDMVALLLEEPNGIDAAPSRGDYIDTADGLKFIEFNVGALGGLHTDTLGELYLHAAPTARFLREQNRRARASGIRKALFRHLVQDTVEMGVWEGGDFNVAAAVRPHAPSVIALHSEERYTRELREVLAEHGPARDGRILFCALDEIASGPGGLTLRGHPIHAVLELHNGQADPRQVFRAFKLGYANLFGGPVGDLLSDKRNLALLSEHAASDELTAGERAILERHLPWTRRVVPGVTRFRGRPLRLPGDLAQHRKELVLKKASSLGGDFVEIGRFRTEEQWQQAIARAVWEEDWIVQEFLETVPYCFQAASHGALRHDLVWGLFAFGGTFGGAYLRMRPTDDQGGVNTKQGAEIGAVLEVD